MEIFNTLYNELIEISKELNIYYDIDKIKSYSVYVWTKGDDEENVFDIESDKITFYNKEHIITEKAKPIIKKIQDKLKEIEESC